MKQILLLPHHRKLSLHNARFSNRPASQWPAQNKQKIESRLCKKQKMVTNEKRRVSPVSYAPTLTLLGDSSL